MISYCCLVQLKHIKGKKDSWQELHIHLLFAVILKQTTDMLPVRDDGYNRILTEQLVNCFYKCNGKLQCFITVMLQA